MSRSFGLRKLFIRCGKKSKKSCEEYSCYGSLSIDLYVDCACILNCFEKLNLKSNEIRHCVY